MTIVREKQIGDARVTLRVIDACGRKRLAVRVEGGSLGGKQDVYQLGDAKVARLVYDCYVGVLEVGAESGD